MSIRMHVHLHVHVYEHVKHWPRYMYVYKCTTYSNHGYMCHVCMYIYYKYRYTYVHVHYIGMQQDHDQCTVDNSWCLQTDLLQRLRLDVKVSFVPSLFSLKPPQFWWLSQEHNKPSYRKILNITNQVIDINQVTNRYQGPFAFTLSVKKSLITAQNSTTNFKILRTEGLPIMSRFCRYAVFSSYLPGLEVSCMFHKWSMSILHLYNTCNNDV